MLTLKGICMTNILTDIVNDFEAALSKLKGDAAPAVKVVENDAKAIGASALSYIKSNGLTDLYTIATGVLTTAMTGTPWATILASVVTKGEAAGITIAKGAEAIVVSQAQADMIAAFRLVSPSTGTTVAS